jgi:hypothetical protein
MGEVITKSTHETLAAPVTFTFQADDGPQVTVENHLYTVELVNTFQGEKNPNWRAQVAAASNATTPASGVKEDAVLGICRQRFKYRDDIGRIYTLQQVGYLSNDLYQPSGTADPSVDDHVRNEALSKFLRRCKSTQTQFGTGVFLGELRETIGLIKRPLQGIRGLVDDYVRGARRGRHLKGRQLSKHLANQWLEFSFGAIPLFSDVESGCEALVRLRNKRKLAMVVGYAEQTVQIAIASVVMMGYAGWYREDTLQTYKVSRKLRGAVRLQSGGDSAELQQGLGLTLRDFIPTAYELIPYSFLVDYFSNVGQIIEGWSFCQADLAWFTDTTRREGILFRTPSGFHGRPYPGDGNTLLDYSFTPQQSIRRYKNFSRGVPVSLGLPSLELRVPGTSTKFLNIAALASARVL